jgi:flavin-dependent thymidylate synthase
MEVKLIDFSGAGSSDPARHAANVLVFTKQTRLNMVAGLMQDIEAWPWEKVKSELEYMANTIPSSWEMVSYTFLINGVTRAFTHQFVRTRTGSYAQQTLRVLDVSGWDYLTGPSLEQRSDASDAYHDQMGQIAATYDYMINKGAKIEDARGILPTNILTNIVAKFDLRTFADTQRKRASSRTQGEYRDVMAAMRAEVLRVHPWAEMFLDRTFDKAAAELEKELLELVDREDWRGAKLEMGFSKDDATRLIKLIDQMRMTA